MHRVDEREVRSDRVLAADVGDLGERQTLVGGLRGVAADDHPVRWRQLVEREGRGLARVLPLREEHGHRRLPVLVRVHVGGDVDAGRARVVELPDQLVRTPPQALHRELHVGDLDRDLGFPADADDLVDGLEERAILAPHVADVASADPGGDARERDELLGLGVDPRIVLETAREPQRAGFEILPQQLGHLLDLGFGRRTAVVVTHDRAAEAAVARVRRDVHRGRRGADLGIERGEREPGAPVLTHDDRRDPLAHDRRRLPCREKAAVVMAVCVDEARREHEPAPLDHAVARGRLELADVDDDAVADPDGAVVRGRARPVDDRDIDEEHRFGRRFTPA